MSEIFSVIFILLPKIKRFEMTNQNIYSIENKISNLKSIKNIIFDLGGVLLNIDIRLTFESFKEMGVERMDDLYKELVNTHFFNDFEKGFISYPEFRNELRKFFHKSLTDEVIDRAWNKMLIDFPVNRINMLLQLKNNYRTFLLSNTNEEHCLIFNKMLTEKYGIKKIEDLFEKAYFSQEIHMRKPDKEIYKYVLDNSKLLPNETLFIDDVFENIEASAQLGIQSYWLKNGDEVVNLFYC